MKHGFMLLELIVATLIASMISGVLLTALYQSSRVQLSIDDVIDMSERIAIVAHQLEKDLAGAFVPEQAEKKEEAEKTPQKTPEKKEETAQKPGQTAEQKPAQQKKEKPKPIEKIFYSPVTKEGTLEKLTFVTNNPLVVFVGKDVGVVKPKIARVQYTLQPDPEKKGSHVLYRQESSELDVAAYTNVRQYELIGGVKKCTLSFIARIQKKQEEKAGKEGEKQKISYEYKTMHEWTSEPKKEETEKKQEFPRIPYAVEWKITLWDKQEKRDREFTLMCHIPVDSLQAKKEEVQQPEKEKKQPETPQESKKPAAPGGIQPQPGKK